MSESVSVRLDDEALRALAQLEASGLTRSEAIRHAIVRAAASQRRSAALRREAAGLEADLHDRREMVAVARLMERLRVAR